MASWSSSDRQDLVIPLGTAVTPMLAASAPVFQILG